MSCLTLPCRDIEPIQLIRELNASHGINLAGVNVIFAFMRAAGRRNLGIPADRFPEPAAARPLWE